MTEPKEDLAPFVERAASLLGVPLTAEHLPGVIRNFENFRALFETVEGFEEPEAPDPLGVYRP